MEIKQSFAPFRAIGIGAVACLSAALLGSSLAWTSDAEHARQDLVGVPIEQIERLADPRVGLRPKTGAANQVSVQALIAGPDVSGSWGPVQPAPVVPVFVALLPNGKVLMWDSVGDNATENYPVQDFTRAAVFDPTTGFSTRIDVQGSNIFCAGFVQLSDGRIFVAGGNKDTALNGIKLTHIFDWRTMTWTRGPDMTGERWYPSVAALMDGQALIAAGGPTIAEIRAIDGSIRQLTGITSPSGREYPFLQSAPDGRVLHSGPSSSIRRLNWWGSGSLESAVARDMLTRSYGSYATYSPGLTLVTGGGSETVNGIAVPTNTAVIIDTRSGVVQATPAASMSFRRRQHNLTILADGSLLATGGMYETGDGLINLSKAVFAAERWDPNTNSWATLSSAQVVRQYHSTAMLLPDGRVLTGGGGICGSCQAQGYLRKDMEIFSPPYLFAKDGSGNLAVRPVVTNAPQQITISTTFQISTPQASSIQKAALVRLGAPTHSQDQGQRYIPLSFTAGAGILTIDGPLNPAEAPPGYYMLFILDAAGVPAVAPIIQVVLPSAGTATATGARNGGAPAILYSDIGSVGRAQSIDAGSWRASRGNLGYVRDNAISSIDVANGWNIMICQQDDLTQCVTYGPGVANVPVSLNDTTSSVRVQPFAPTSNRAPVAVAAASPVSGLAPLTVQFDASASSDPDQNPLTFAWDLDGDGAVDDSNTSKPLWTYTTAGAVNARVQVSDGSLTANSTVTVNVTNAAPFTGRIVNPVSGKCAAVVTSRKDPTALILWTCGNGTDQRWTVRADKSLLNAATNKCADLRSGSTANGTIVQVNTCNGSSAQRWTSTPQGNLVNEASKRCLDYYRAKDGTKLVINDCRATASQTWQLPS